MFTQYKLVMKKRKERTNGSNRKILKHQFENFSSSERSRDKFVVSKAVSPNNWSSVKPLNPFFRQHIVNGKCAAVTDHTLG